jgi:GntR family transcriptional regulator/MocR family aminotransferase
MRSRGWADLHAWELDRSAGAPPFFRQVYTQVRTAILSGALGLGTKLPSTRAMATQLGLARASVVAAYEQLLAEGYAEPRAGSGTYVASDFTEFAKPGHGRRGGRSGRPLPDLAGPGTTFERAPMKYGHLPFNTGRTLVDARTNENWRRLTHRAVRSLGVDDLGYTDPCGLIELRRQIAEYLRAARAVRCEPEQVVVTAGTQQAIDIAVRVILTPGDTVWVEDPGYPLTHEQLRLSGLLPLPVPVDEQGIIVESGARSGPNARAVFVTPSHQFPTGVPLSMGRRLDLLAWARESGAYIVEDDYTSEFRYSGPPLASLQGLDEDARVIYVGTLNKALFPGLRLGYAIVPPALLDAFSGIRYLTDRQPPTLYQAVVAAFMREGHFAAHIRRMRHAYREQRDVLSSALMERAGEHLDVAIPEQGMHLVAYLKNARSDLEVEAAARRAGVVVRGISRFYHAAPARSGLMLGFSGYPLQLILPAAAKLASVLTRQARARSF